MNKKSVIVCIVAGFFAGLAAFLLGFAISINMGDRSLPSDIILIVSIICALIGSLVACFGQIIITKGSQESSIE